MKQKRAFIITALVALLAGGLFTSCTRVSSPAQYEIVFGFIELTPPQKIADPDLRALYDQMLDESWTLKTRVDGAWEVWIDNYVFDRADNQAVSRYNSNLALVKEFEAKWQKTFEDFGVETGSSFSIKFVYDVKRWLPSEKYHYLQEYNFDINYN